jgi:hypothetical protein
MVDAVPPPPKGPTARMIAAIADWLAPPGRAERAALACALLLALPTLLGGFHLDDWWHVTLLSTAPPAVAAQYMYQFTFDAAARTEAAGLWWGSPDLRLAFWRPLSAWVSVGDFELFGQHALGWHLDALLWRLGLVAVGSRLLRRELGDQLAAAAIVVFAIDDVGWLPVAWLASRNAMIAALPALLGLLAHIRWRRDGWVPGLPLSALGLALGLAGGEAAVGVYGYFLAFELVGVRGRAGERLLGVLPSTLVLLAWATLYRATGHGTFGSGMYIDPVAEPLEWLRHAPERALALIGCLCGGVPADLWYVGDGWRPLLIGTGIQALTLWIPMLRRSQDDRTAQEERAVRWLALGALLSLAPVLSTSPAGRLLIPASLGTAAALAAILRWWWRVRWTEQDPGLNHRLAAGVYGAIAFVGGPITWVVTTAMFVHAGNRLVERALDADLGDDASATHAVIVVAPEAGTAFFLPEVRFLHGASVPGAWDVLSIAPCPQVVRRPRADTLDIETDGTCRMVDTELERLVRRREAAFDAGDVVSTPAFDVEILAVSHGRPTRAAFRFHRDLADPSLRFVAWDGDRIVRFALPAVGGSVRLPGAEPASAGL